MQRIQALREKPCTRLFVLAVSLVLIQSIVSVLPLACAWLPSQHMFDSAAYCDCDTVSNCGKYLLLELQ